MKFTVKVLEFTRRPEPGLPSCYDTRKATVEITEMPFLWFMKPKINTIKVYKPYANWKFADTGSFCDNALNNFLNAYEELNEL